MTHGITLSIQRVEHEQERFRVQAFLDAGDESKSATFTLSGSTLRALALNPFAYGMVLSNGIFTEPIRKAYETALERGRETGSTQVRIKIDENAPELHAISWERLYHFSDEPPLPLATQARTPFSRYTGLPLPDATALAPNPLGILVAIAHPTDLPAAYATIDVEAEIEMLLTALAHNPPPERTVTLLAGKRPLTPPLKERIHAAGWQLLEEPVTPENMVRNLQGAVLLHLIGHGSFDSKSGKATLHLEDDEGRWRRVHDDEFVTKLAGLTRPPQLIFLAACDSAARSRTEAFMGLAPRLVQQGIPAVIAMQTPVSMDAARQLTKDFYRLLLPEGRVDLALNQARNLLFEKESLDWSVPVLFLRIPDGRLWTTGDEQTAAADSSGGITIGTLNAVNVAMRDQTVNMPNATFNFGGWTPQPQADPEEQSGQDDEI